MSSAKIEDEVTKQINKANRTIGSTNKHLSTETTTRLYKSVINPFLTYACETRPDTSVTQRLFKMTEMRVFRRIKKSF